MITRKQYIDTTLCLGDYTLRFEFDEIQQYLINLGYSILIYEKEGLVNTTKSEDCEVIDMGKQVLLIKRVIAIKNNEILPEDNGSKEAVAMDIMNVFKREIKNKLLGF